MNHGLIKTLKIPSVILVVGFLALGFACAGIFNHGSMHDSVSAATAISANSGQECCNTNISKHIESWKDTLLVLPRELKDGLLLLFLSLVAIFSFINLRSRHDPDELLRFSYRLYTRNNPELALFDHLKFAFARGILNPKIY